MFALGLGLYVHCPVHLSSQNGYKREADVLWKTTVPRMVYLRKILTCRSHQILAITWYTPAHNSSVPCYIFHPALPSPELTYSGPCAMNFVVRSSVIPSTTVAPITLPSLRQLRSGPRTAELLWALACLRLYREIGPPTPFSLINSDFDYGMQRVALLASVVVVGVSLCFYVVSRNVLPMVL